MLNSTAFWTIADWRQAYLKGQTARTLLPALLDALPAHDPAWISVIDQAALQARLAELDAACAAPTHRLDQLPLYGVPFAVKDNIDVAGLPTTCACPAFSYRPDAHAAVVDRLLKAGAVVIGKTNLDQFATGLVGTRSPYGAVPNAFDARFISGGSSSGSASVVARGLVPFALGSDTAGSGRVPAGLNNLVGFKPTRGLVSTRGLVPACRTLDCVSAFTLNVDDAEYVMQIMAGFDQDDPYSARPLPQTPWPATPTLGVPTAPLWHGDAASSTAYHKALRKIEAAHIATLVPVDFAPLHQIAALLYEGPWVAERYAVLEHLLQTKPDAVHAVVRSIIERARDFSAVDAFKAEYQRAALTRKIERLMAGLDGLLVPTSPGIYTIEAVLADPLQLNSHMGTYTNFVNFLNMCAMALPGGMREDGLPFGITVIAPAWHEAQLTAFGRRWQSASPWNRGAAMRGLR